MVREINPNEDYESLTLTCRQCGWEGLGSESAGIEVFEELAVVECPRCFGSLAYLLSVESREDYVDDRAFSSVSDRVKFVPASDVTTVWLSAPLNEDARAPDDDEHPCTE